LIGSDDCCSVVPPVSTAAGTSAAFVAERSSTGRRL
jgi:hypothetical protein